MIEPPIEILKSLWTRRPDGRWAITDAKALRLRPQQGFSQEYFLFQNDVELLTNRPSSNLHEMIASFGTIDFLLKQSILPVIAWKQGDNVIRSIGTSSVISCSGYLLTAAHVLMDPIERGYGAKRHGNRVMLDDNFHFGVIIPMSPAYGFKGFRIFEFEKFWLWGRWELSPLFNEPAKFVYSTDIAVCKIAEMPNEAAHQPLNMSLNSFSVGEGAYSIGYAEMDDIGLVVRDDGWAMEDFELSLFVSSGEVMNVFAENHLNKDVPTPGPCFDFKAKIPGKMSGAPIFGAGGIVVRGVVSRSFSGDRHAYGAMLGPVMDMPLYTPTSDGQSLRQLVEVGNEGITLMLGQQL